jgi:hypothetical protein
LSQLKNQSHSVRSGWLAQHNNQNDTVAFMTMQNASYAKITQDDEDAAAAAASSYNGDTPLLTIPEQGSMTMTAVVASSPTVQVEAPADLPEGYEFQATLPGQQCMIKVTVPPGGVEKGQYFAVPLPTNAVGAQFFNDGLLGSGGSHNGRIISIPVGHWRDGLFEFYKYGICHPHCWTACCCSTCKCCFCIFSSD